MGTDKNIKLHIVTDIKKRNKNLAMIKFYSAWFCPYAQRTWIALNHLGLAYELIESLEHSGNGYIKNKTLLQLNPKGLVPTLNVDNEVVVESIDTIEYLSSHFGNGGMHFVSPDLIKDAHVVNKSVCSPFYQILMKQEKDEQDAAWEEFVEGLKMFTENVQTNGYFKSSSMSVVDITLFPWAYRLYLLEDFRGKHLDKDLLWTEEFFAWYERMLHSKAVLDTIPNKDNLKGMYVRYAQGTAKSKVADAVRDGKQAHDIQ